MRIATTQLWVHDQEAAVSFWVDKVGMEIREDVTVPEMGGFRWLTVGVRGQDAPAIVLMSVTQGPFEDDSLREQVLDLTAKGLTGTVFLEVDDCRTAYDELTARGVEFSEPPTEYPYGLDASFRDPSGNYARLIQRHPGFGR